MASDDQTGHDGTTAPSSEPPSTPGARGIPGRRAGVALIVLLAAAVAAERGRWFPSLLDEASVERVWIWTADPPRRVEPSAFYLARDFDLASVPPEATLEILGDPEYVVHLNGRRVGSGRSGTEAVIDRYAVAPMLSAGRNRIVVEMRSGTGSGISTVRLVDEADRTLVASDGEWVVYRNSWRGLWSGNPFYPTGRAAVISRVPFGRWAEAGLGPLRPRFDEVSAGEAIAASAYRVDGRGEWHPLPARGAERRHLGGHVEIDFGREVTGYLHLVLRRNALSRGLARFADESGRQTTGWESSTVVLTPAQRGSWQDVEPRTFRYVELLGLEEVSGAAVLQVDPSRLNEVTNTAPWRGLLGTEPRSVRIPLVDGVLREELVGHAEPEPVDAEPPGPEGAPESLDAPRP